MIHIQFHGNVMKEYNSVNVGNVHCKPNCLVYLPGSMILSPEEMYASLHLSAIF